MIDGSEKRNRQLAFELQNSHVCETCSNVCEPFCRMSSEVQWNLDAISCQGTENSFCTAQSFVIVALEKNIICNAGYVVTSMNSISRCCIYLLYSPLNIWFLY